MLAAIYAKGCDRCEKKKKTTTLKLTLALCKQCPKAVARETN